MCNKFYSIIFGALCIICLVSCDQPSIQTSPKKTTSVSISDKSIIISDDTKQSFELQVKIGEQVAFSNEVSANQETSFSSLLKSKSDLNMDIALMLAQNNGSININLNLPNVLDTTIIYHLDIKDVSDYSTKVLTGKCASLVGVFDSENVESDIIKWLYRKNLKNVGDETIKNMRIYLRELNRNDWKQYVTLEEIPVITSFRGTDYIISSDLVADNYYLFACSSEEELEEFIEEMVSIKFDGAIHSLSQPIMCYRPESSSGTLCIFLVGINNDWSYNVVPIGLICIDNVDPINKNPVVNINGFNISYSGSTLSDGSYDRTVSKPANAVIEFEKNKFTINMPSEVPVITGCVILQTQNWSGNYSSSNVNFSITYAGDVKDITLIREDNLAKWLGKNKKTIELQQVPNPYYFSYELHLEEGDNYMPVIITDLRGNKLEFMYNVECITRPTNTPQINIDNNVIVN